MNFKEPAEIIKSSKSALVITGAGISVESGVPTYRGQGGLYTNSPALEKILTAETLKTDPLKIWGRINKMRIIVKNSSPNNAHKILAKWEEQNIFSRFLISTQNIDGLHKEAGSKRVSELHGNIWEFARPDKIDFSEDEQFSQDMSTYLSGNDIEHIYQKWSHDNNHIVWENRETPFKTIPPCPEDPDVRPNVLLFNESYGNRLLWVDHFIKKGCDLLLIAGCSGGVYILDRIINIALTQNTACKIININPFEDCIDKENHIFLEYSAVEAFEAIDNYI